MEAPRPVGALLVESDGTVLYLFSLRNKADNYARNLEIFEKAIATVQFKASK